MSGLAGFVRLDGAPARTDALRRMIDVLVQRGPHGEGTYVEGAVALGHRALHGLPEAALERQPVVSRGRAIVADLRLDNREEIASDLEIPTSELAGIGDAGLVLRAYDAWGDDCPARLLGDFAFAIWDAPRRRLVCARDPFGARPFVYGRTDRVFAFASDTRALHALGELPRRPDEGRIADFLVDAGLETLDATSTFWLDLRRLPPAHVLVLADGAERTRRYWTPDPSPSGLVGPAARDAFRATFTEAVRCRARGDATGAMLSGGLDSTAIVGVAKGEGLVRTFSAIGDDPAICPDRRYVEAAVAEGGLLPTFLHPSDVAAFAGRVQRRFEESDDPFDGYACALPLLVYASAAEAGMRVLLDGVDGDLVTCPAGNGILPSLRAGDAAGAWRRAGNAARHYGVARSVLFVEEGLAPALWADAVRPRLPGPLATALRGARLHDAARRATRVSVIHPTFARAVDLEGRLDRMRRTREACRLGASPGWDHAANLLWPGVAAGLERYDRAAASQSVETSHPFFDRRLVELCLSLSWEEKAGDGVPKPLLRAALADVLAPAVRDRGWSLSPHFQFKRALVRALEPWIAAKIANIGIAGERVRSGAVRRAWDGWRRGDLDQADLLLELAGLVAWLEHALDAPRPWRYS